MVILSGFIVLTLLDGTPIWIDRDRIEIMRQSLHHVCKEDHGAAIRIAGRGLCVRETPAEIEEKIRGK